MKLRSLTPELEKVARDELGETPEVLEKSLNEIKAFLDEHPYIKARRDDQFLAIFLRSCRYDLEKVKQRIEAYYMATEKLPEYFKNVDTTDKKYKEILKLG